MGVAKRREKTGCSVAFFVVSYPSDRAFLNLVLN
jgi:hypothetical protein